VTQSTSTLAATLFAVEREAALFPREDADVVAVELGFESLDPRLGWTVERPDPAT
jgi:hypothetical protein